MSIDLEYNYEDSLVRQKLFHVEVEKIRHDIELFEHVPKSLTNKQVS